jgi:hypothetical protein
MQMKRGSLSAAQHGLVGHEFGGAAMACYLKSQGLCGIESKISKNIIGK